MVRWTADSAGPRWTADRGCGGASPVCGGGRWSSPVLTGDGGEDKSVEAVLGRCSPVTEGWHSGGALEARNGGGLSSSRGRRRVRRSLIERG
jgi:hypothetical protein